MGDLASSSPTTAVLPVVFADGDQSVDLGTVTVQPSLSVRKLQAVVADRIGVAPHQIASLASPRRARRVTLDEGADLAGLRRSRRDRRGGRSRREKKAAAGTAPPQQERTILKRLPPTDLASLAAAAVSPAPPPPMFGAWDYEAQLHELQRQREWYLMHTAAADPYILPLAPEREDPPLWCASWPPPRQGPCPDCEAAAAAMREPVFHRCVRDAVTVGFRSPVGPIERPAKKPPSPSPPPQPASPGRLRALVGLMPVY